MLGNKFKSGKQNPSVDDTKESFLGFISFILG